MISLHYKLTSDIFSERCNDARPNNSRSISGDWHSFFSRLRRNHRFETLQVTKKIPRSRSIATDISHQRHIASALKLLDVDTLIDVGAYEGKFRHNLDGAKLKHVFMFEPNPEKYAALGEEDGTTAFNLALSSQSGAMTFLINENLDTTSTLEKAIDQSAMLYLIKTKILKRNYGSKIIVKTSTLDEFFTADDFGKCFLKIDAEGSDYDVLVGGENFLEKVTYVFIEVKKLNFYKNCRKSDIFRLLFRKGFKKKKTFSTFPHFYQDVLFEREV